MVRHLMDADRIIHLIRGRLGFSLTIEQVNKVAAQYGKLIETAWSLVYKFIPRLTLIKPSSWRQMNDTSSEKAVLAGRFGSVAFLPRSEELGGLAMAVKLLNVQGLELRQTGKLDEIEQLASSYKNLMSSLETVNKEAAKAFNITLGPRE